MHIVFSFHRLETKQSSLTSAVLLTQNKFAFFVRINRKKVFRETRSAVTITVSPKMRIAWIAFSKKGKKTTSSHSWERALWNTQSLNKQKRVSHLDKLCHYSERFYGGCRRYCTNKKTTGNANRVFIFLPIYWSICITTNCKHTHEQWAYTRRVIISVRMRRRMTTKKMVFISFYSVPFIYKLNMLKRFTVR